MTATEEFPSSCSTNSYLLHDFGEIALIVCTVSTPPSSSHTIQRPSPESNLARLRLTESQFREASILAIIDSETSQLFTFYKKVDVLKDQKALLHKFGLILRSNSCIIAYKSAARVPDLFRPEQAKLYRLFVSAILASIKLKTNDDREVVPLGQRYNVVKRITQHPHEPESVSAWCLVRTDLQVIQSGHVVLTVVVNDDFNLVPVSLVTSELPKVTGVVLAPGGQIAFYRNEFEAGGNATLPFESTSMTAQRRAFWQVRVASWMKSAGYEDVIPESASWIELMLPVFEQKVGESLDESSPKLPSESERRLIFKPVLWPAHMCFARALDTGPENVDTSGDEDPLQFVLDWIQTVGEREAELQQRVVDDAMDEDSPLFADEGPFDNMETFQPFGPPTFPTSQTVYPTPPDAIMTNATPAMSSVDGLATTPAAISRGMAEIHPGRQDVEMTGAAPSQVSAVGSGLYEEDLFEEMPQGTFDQRGGATEPNWDFFDKPGPDVAQQAEGSSTVDDEPPQPKLQRASSASSSIHRPPQQSSPLASIAPTEVKPGFVLLSKSDQIKSANPIIQPRERAKPHTAHYVESRSTLDDSAGAISLSRRRRSSLYDGADPRKSNKSYDSKYSRKGEFWFDAAVQTQPQQSGQRPQSSRLLDSSVSSETDSAGPSTENEHCSAPESPNSARSNIAPHWHDYKPVPPAGGSQGRDFDLPALEVEIKTTMDLLKAKSGGSLLEDLFTRKRMSAGKAGLSAELRLMLAQIFVDQYTQASLIHGEMDDEERCREFENRSNISIDLSQMNATASYATLSQLTDITSPIAGRLPMGKISRLTDVHFKIKRSDKPMVATPMIIPFWDTLALQPQSRPKDISAFCLHPAGAGYADASAHFLDRIADAYNSCGLGVHDTGQLPGLTNNGIIAMTPEPMTVARRFAETLTSNAETIGTAIVYIVAKNAHPRSYIGCCRYFLGLFTYYQKFAASRGKLSEVILQIIPGSFLVSNHALVVPPQRKFNDLAFEIYSRIPPDPTAPAGICDYPVVLADTGNDVNFSLDSHPVSPSMQKQSVIHLAYSFTEDQRWLLATWTDNSGQKALIMTYQLKVGNESKGRPREDIMRNMWEVSHDLMKKQRNKWRLVVARSGFYEAGELNGLMHLANAEAGRQRCELVLLSIELQPTLRLLPPVPQAKVGQPPSSSQPATYGTPVSTPQAISSTSPENLIPATPTPGGTLVLNAPTPPEHSFDTGIDSDLSLTDPTKESWAVILPFGMNQSSNMLDIRPALCSGYLVKRMGTKDDDGTTMIGVHLVHVPAQRAPAMPGQQEELLEEILDNFRGLVTLAVARGCIDAVRQVLPWHIHTSVTGASVLGTLL